MDNVEKMIINQCRNIGLELNIPAICQVVDAHSELLSVEQPVFTFLDLSGQPDHLSVIAEYLCEKDILR